MQPASSLSRAELAARSPRRQSLRRRQWPRWPRTARTTRCRYGSVEVDALVRRAAVSSAALGCFPRALCEARRGVNCRVRHPAQHRRTRCGWLACQRDGRDAVGALSELSARRRAQSAEKQAHPKSKSLLASARERRLPHCQQQQRAGGLWCSPNFSLIRPPRHLLRLLQRRPRSARSRTQSRSSVPTTVTRPTSRC